MLTRIAVFYAAVMLGLLDGPAHELRTDLLVFAPPGGTVLSATKDGSGVGLDLGHDGDRTVATVSVLQLPQRTSTLVFSVTTSPEAGRNGATPTLQLTPGVHPWRVAVSEQPRCR